MTRQPFLKSTTLPTLLSTIDTAKFVDIRRQLHAYPELGFEVGATSKLVASLLAEWGYEVHTGIGRSGVVAQMKLGSSTRRLGIRADMDALPIHEATGLPYASKWDGRMHACGHDGHTAILPYCHTAILLAAAKALADSRGFDGTLNLIFQPDEENLCGARNPADDQRRSRNAVRAGDLRRPGRRRQCDHASVGITQWKRGLCLDAQRSTWLPPAPGQW